MGFEQREVKEFMLGPFNMGDLIALAGILLACGALWWRVGAIEKDNERARLYREALAVRVSALEQLGPQNYVTRQEYREDLRELRETIDNGFLRLESRMEKTNK